ncbi:MAG TPA: hypothetical protein VN853_05465 [Polyangia bacterium]|nr:hypothetical protein [Polyangia bacterium]
MTGGFKLACALLGIAAAGCQQTWVLDESALDGGRPGTGGTSGVGPSDASVDGRCFGNPMQIMSTGDRPLVVVALDRSSDMASNQLIGSNNSELDEAVNDLLSQVQSYAPSGQHPNRRTLDFAYLGFPQGTTCGTQGCCASAADLEDSYSAFSAAAMICDSPSSTCDQSASHPLSVALQNASAFFEFGAEGSPANERFILVVTDAAPAGNCSISGEDDCHAAADEVVTLSSSNITTVVVSIGNAQPISCFQNFIGDQGGAPPPYYNNATNDASLYYSAQNAQDLQDRIGLAIQAMAWGTCRFSLSSAPSSQNNLAVSQVQGTTMTPIEQDPKSGWTYDSYNNRLTLHGSACNNYIMNEFGGLQVFDTCSTNRGSL